MVTSKAQEVRGKKPNVPKVSKKESGGNYIEGNELKEDVIRIISSTVIASIIAAGVWFFFFR